MVDLLCISLIVLSHNITRLPYKYMLLLVFDVDVIMVKGAYVQGDIGPQEDILLKWFYC